MNGDSTAGRAKAVEEEISPERKPRVDFGVWSQVLVYAESGGASVWDPYALHVSPGEGPFTPQERVRCRFGSEREGWREMRARPTVLPWPLGTLMVDVAPRSPTCHIVTPGGPIFLPGSLVFGGGGSRSTDSVTLP